MSVRFIDCAFDIQEDNKNVVKSTNSFISLISSIFGILFGFYILVMFLNMLLSIVFKSKYITFKVNNQIYNFPKNRYDLYQSDQEYWIVNKNNSRDSYQIYYDGKEYIFKKRKCPSRINRFYITIYNGPINI